MAISCGPLFLFGSKNAMGKRIELLSWVPIFKGGCQEDTTGREHDGDAIIERSIRSFNPTYHEPPLTVGETTEVSPAYGWVQELKKRADNGKAALFARFRQVPFELAKLAREGFYSTISMSIYPDGKLRAVKLMGGEPPQLKWLKGFSFKEKGGDPMTIDFIFDEQSQQTMNPGDILEKRIRELLANPPKCDFYGREIRHFDYYEAYKLVSQELPDVARAYIESIKP